MEINADITVDDLLKLEGGDFKLEDDKDLSDKDKDIQTPKEEEKPDDDIQDLEDEDVIPPKEEEKEEDNISKETTPDFYVNVSKKLLNDGKWQDVLIEIDGREVKLSEIEELDEETFYDIYAAQEETKEEDLKTNYVSIKEIDEDKRKLINIIKNGGDLKEIFQSPESVKRPFEDIDLTNETTQKAIVFQQYKKQGLSESEARDLTEKAAKEFTLDTKAESIVKAYQEHYDKMLTEKEKEVLENKKAEELAIKEYRKNLANSYKQENLSDTLTRRLVDAATKKDQDGELVIDGIYQKLMDDPEKAKDLIFFMLEPENYLKAKGAKIKSGAQIDMMKKVTIIRESGNKNSSKEKQEEKPATDPFSAIVLE